MSAARVEMLRSALRFYADPANWQAREIESFLPPEQMPTLEMDGTLIPMVCMQTGPAIDGGEHARYVLAVLDGVEEFTLNDLRGHAGLPPIAGAFAKQPLPAGQSRWWRHLRRGVR